MKILGVKVWETRAKEVSGPLKIFFFGCPPETAENRPKNGTLRKIFDGPSLTLKSM